MDIQDKIVIITGGTSGIGLASVKALLKQGAKHVAIFDLDTQEEAALKIINDLENIYKKGSVGYYSCDVTKPTEFAARYDEIVGSMRKVDILINNAGILNELNYELMIDINFKGVVSCTLTGLDRMGKHHGGSGGTIINVCSIMGLIEHPGLLVYTATKHAVYGFTKSLKEYSKTLGVNVMVICPGVTRTNLFCDDWEIPKFVPKEYVEALKNLQVPQSSENVANAIIKMIKEGKPGEAWVSENEKPPFLVSGPEDYQKKGKYDLGI